MKCKFFETGTCPHKDRCVYGHEDNGYKYLIMYTKLSRRKVESEPEPTVVEMDLTEFPRDGGQLDDGDDDEFEDLMRELGKY